MIRVERELLFWFPVAIVSMFSFEVPTSIPDSRDEDDEEDEM